MILTIQEANTKLCPVHQGKCISGGCMWWVSKRVDGKGYCGMIATAYTPSSNV